MSDDIETEMTPVSEPAAQPPASAVSRREFLKVALGAGGAVLAAGLPEKWSQPVVEAVHLPPHALATPTRTPSPTPAPVAPSQLSATVSQHKVALSWTSAWNCQVERSADKVTWTVIATGKSQSYTDADAALQIGRPYYYRVRATRADGTATEPSNIVSATP